MPAEPNTMIQLVQDLGFGMASLTFSGWLIIFLLRGFEKERNIWLTKDSESDIRAVSYTHLRAHET